MHRWIYWQIIRLKWHKFRFLFWIRSRHFLAQFFWGAWLIWILNLTHNFESHRKSWSYTNFTFYDYFSAHLLNDWFTYAETESTTLWISFLVFFEVAKINEKIFQLICWNPNAKVLNTKLKLNVDSFLFRSLALCFFAFKFICGIYGSSIIGNSHKINVFFTLWSYN